MSQPDIKLVESQRQATPDSTPTKKRRERRPFPAFPIERTIEITEAIASNNAGRPYSRLSIADVLGKSPDSSSFRDLITSSSQYGFTKGSYQASQISLTPLGERLAMPKSDIERRNAMKDAMLAIPLYRQLLNHFDQNRLPPQEHLTNTLVRDFQVSTKWAKDCAAPFIENARFVGFIRSVSGAERVVLDPQDQVASHDETDEDLDDEMDQTSTEISIRSSEDSVPATPPHTNRVFITHGSNTSIVIQLKELLRFGRFEPVVAEEEQTTSLPVPDKVLDAMRSCFAGVIHVEGERTLLDEAGQQHHSINQNVLIEIGAAMALYRRNFILLVRRGVQLPSNLQGLYLCYYDGDKLDFEATMKLLQIFNGFTD